MSRTFVSLFVMMEFIDSSKGGKKMLLTDISTPRKLSRKTVFA